MKYFNKMTIDKKKHISTRRGSMRTARRRVIGKLFSEGNRHWRGRLTGDWQARVVDGERLAQTTVEWRQDGSQSFGV